MWAGTARETERRTGLNPLSSTPPSVVISPLFCLNLCVSRPESGTTPYGTDEGGPDDQGLFNYVTSSKDTTLRVRWSLTPTTLVSLYQDFL